eukprot:TRINITY_DN5076_c0_g1_i2.p1 TRINITY_DN5076_c0_g1~~TRINITY_DN5076_c0_g1_i2.p1  ORF type:complete len:493 (+),score=78.41 TRINITY_DN5076_c0_g1_i2:62-1480(+)
MDVTSVISWVLCILGICVAIICLQVVLLRWRTKRVRESRRVNSRKRIGFFHPYSTGGGGGERVLWTMLAGMQKELVDADFILYTHFTDNQTHSFEDVAKKVRTKFGVTLSREVEISPIRNINWVEPKSYPRFTLVLQSLGAIPLAIEALWKSPPDIFIDTMGYAFTYPVATLIGSCFVACYTHYPTVSSDMLKAVASRRSAHNNMSAISSSWLLTNCKIYYYKFFSFFYGIAGRQSHIILVNSTWTQEHIKDVWKLPTSRVHRVYPPCDCTKLLSLSEDTSSKSDIIISVAQFRPEKDHELQIRSFAKALKEVNISTVKRLRLVLVGGVRNDEDREKVESLKKYATELGVADNVDFKVDLPYPELLELLASAKIGIHTMWNEHFGIGIVEYMAAAAIPIAHRSGGPLLDIVSSSSGFLAEDVEEYSEAILKILRMDQQTLSSMQQQARQRSKLFSEEVFNTSISRLVTKAVK